MFLMPGARERTGAARLNKLSLPTLSSHGVAVVEGKSNITSASIGTAGRVLLDKGAGVDPAFTALSGDVSSVTNTGSVTVASISNNKPVVLLTTLSSWTGAAISDTTHITASFNDYLVTLDNVASSTTGVTLALTVTVSGTNQTSNYVNAGAGSTAAIQLTPATTISNASGSGGYSGFFVLHNVNSSGGISYKAVEGRALVWTSGTALSAETICGAYNGSTSTVTGITLTLSAGNGIGTIRIYGLP